MPNVKISDLPLATSPLDGTVVMPVVQGGATKRAPVNAIGFVQPGAGAVARTVQDKLEDTISAADYTSLSNAIASAKVSGRPTTILVNGTINVPSTIVVDASNITLQGAGGDTVHDVGAQGANARAILNWTGSPGGTVLQFVSPSGFSNQCQTGGGVKDIYFECSSGAAIGLQILSWRKGKFENLHFNNPTVAGIDVNVVAILGEARDVQNCEFRNISSRHLETAGGTGGLIRLDGDASANASLNYFEQLDCQFRNGTAYLFNCSDNNYIVRARAFRAGGGSGNAVVFNGDNSTSSRVARSNIFVHLTTNGAVPIIMRGTSSFTHASTDNNMLLLDFDNGYAQPTFEAGASGQWSDTRGLLARFTTVGAAVGADISEALSAKSRLGNSSMHVVNGSQDHIRLSDVSGANTWGISIDGTGNIRVTRISGSANFDLPAQLLLSGQAVTLGAPDSGGTGFRVLRVPN